MHKKLLLLDEIRVVLKLTSALWVTNFVNFLFSDSTKVHEKKKKRRNKNKNKKNNSRNISTRSTIYNFSTSGRDQAKRNERGEKKKKKFKIHAYSHRPGRAVTSEAMPGRYIFISNGNP